MNIERLNKNVLLTNMLKCINSQLTKKVLVRVNYFPNKNRKMATKFEGPYAIVQINKNWALLQSAQGKTIFFTSSLTLHCKTKSYPPSWADRVGGISK